MVQPLIERARRWLYATFPERQIYIRSEGRVQFFTFGAPFQAALAGAGLLFLSWFAFASVNVLFKDHLIVVKDHRYRQMQADYENRIADLQMSYDELNGALVTAQDKFRSAADQLLSKQQAISGLFHRKTMLDAAVAGSSGIASGQSGQTIANALNAGDTKSGYTAGKDGVSELGMAPQPMPPQPRTSGPVRASLFDGAVETFASTAKAWLRRDRRGSGNSSAALSQNPGLRALAAQTNRIENVSRGETGLLHALDLRIEGREASMAGVMRRVGLDPDRLRDRAMGGPTLPLAQAQIDGLADPDFVHAFALTSAHSQDLQTLSAAFAHVPLTTPVHGAAFELTSDFGPRIDPFTHRSGFHPGLDFGGPWGATVAATASGTVVYAGPRGGYGNMVEINHGLGIHTRYGHLSSILVHTGAKVAKGTPVGRLGSTGRSTGPHVHYEVWLADAVRDPSRFIEAGRHVQ